jgi:hypothetical protein
MKMNYTSEFYMNELYRRYNFKILREDTGIPESRLLLGRRSKIVGGDYILREYMKPN